MPGLLSRIAIRLQWSPFWVQFGVTFFALVKTFDANIAFISNFMLIAKNSIAALCCRLAWVCAISLLSAFQISNMALNMDKSQEQWASLGDLSIVTRLPKPWTCGPEGASFSVWMKIQDCGPDGEDGYISSKSRNSNGFRIRCDDSKLR